MCPSRKFHLLSGALIALSVASVQAQQTQKMSDGTKADTVVTGKSAGKSTVSAGDRDLMAQLAQANMAEIAVAELAQTKSSNQQVLNFSKHMIDDHSAALKDVSKLADDKNVQLPKEANAKHVAMLKKMNTLSAAEFDREYIAKAGVQDHQEAKKLVEKTRANAKDADLKALADKMLPTIDAHLKMAQDMKMK